MRKTRLVFGIIFIVCGTAALASCIYWALRLGQLIWIPLILASASTAWTGVRMFLGKKLKEVIHDWLFVLMHMPC